MKCIIRHTTFSGNFLKKGLAAKKDHFFSAHDNPGLLFQTFFSIKLCFIILYSWSIT